MRVITPAIRPASTRGNLLRTSVSLIAVAAVGVIAAPALALLFVVGSHADFGGPLPPTVTQQTTVAVGTTVDVTAQVGPRRLELTMPPYSGRMDVTLGRAVAAQTATYTLEVLP